MGIREKRRVEVWRRARKRTIQAAKGLKAEGKKRKKKVRPSHEQKNMKNVKMQGKHVLRFPRRSRKGNQKKRKVELNMCNEKERIQRRSARLLCSLGRRQTRDNTKDAQGTKRERKRDKEEKETATDNEGRKTSLRCCYSGT